MCPICNQLEFKVIGFPRSEAKVKKILRHNYQVVKCVNCGFYFINPSIDFSESDWQTLYDSDYFPKLTKWHYNQRRKARESRLDGFEAFTDHKINKFLDLGCGTGEMLIDARKRNWEPYGIDITDHRISEAKDRSLIFFQGSLFEAKFPNDYFDCIYMDSVLEHVTEPIRYLNELNRILKKSGVLYIGIPNEDSLFNSFKKIILTIMGKKGEASRLQPFVTPYHIGGFNSKSLNTAITLSKFKIIKFRNFASKMDFLNYNFLSKEFINAFLISMIYWLAVPLRKEIYFEVYLKK
jgi:ubiquinone/menaquinone biosynthesis C-methylase UbiE